MTVVKRRNIHTYSAGQVTTLIDSYSEANCPGGVSSSSSLTGRAQSFRNTNSSVLTSCKFYLNRVGSFTGNTYAYIYAHTGTYGSNGKPTGSALATSDVIDVSAIPLSATVIEYTFSGVNQITLSPNTYYCAVFFHPQGPTTSYSTEFHIDTTSPTHGGNYASTSDGGANWTPNSLRDAAFYVYGLGPISIVN